MSVDHALNQFMTPASQRVLNAFNEANSANLTFEDVVLSNPSWFHDASRPEINTEVSLIATTHTTVSGQSQFHYTRQNIRAVFGDNVPVLQVTPDVTTVHGLIPLFKERYRIHLEPRDLFNAPINPSDTSVTFKVPTDSFGFHGDIQVNLVWVATVLDQDMGNNFGSIGGIDDNEASTRAEIWYGVKRMTTQTTVDGWLSINPAKNDQLTGMMIQTIKDLFDVQWGSIPTTTTDYNLYGATIEYFGTNATSLGLGGSSDDVIAIVRLSEFCANFTGFLIMRLPAHQVQAYNDSLLP